MNFFGIRMPWPTPLTLFPAMAGAGALPRVPDSPAASCFHMDDATKKLRRLLDPQLASQIVGSVAIEEGIPEPLSDYIDWDPARHCYVCRMPQDMQQMYIGPTEFAKTRSPDSLLLKKVHIYRPVDEPRGDFVITLLAGDFIMVNDQVMFPDAWAWLEPGTVMDLARGVRVIFEPELIPDPVPHETP